MVTVMATLESAQQNLGSSSSYSPSKKRSKRARSKAYRKKRSSRRKLQTFYQIKQMCDLSKSVVRTNSERWRKDGEESAYWKSRAMSLHYENQMLYKHIEEIYSNMVISKYENTIHETTGNCDEVHETNGNCDEVYETTGNCNEVYETVGNCDEVYETTGNCNEVYWPAENWDEDYEDNVYLEQENTLYHNEDNTNHKPKTKQDEQDVYSQPPCKINTKELEEEKKKLYGSNWRAILGMETVVQLNYDVNLDKHKIKYWPIMPLKM